MSKWAPYDRIGSGECGAVRSYAWATATLLRNRFTRPGVWMLRASELRVEDVPIRCDSIEDAQKAAHKVIEGKARELFAAVEGGR